LDAVKTSAAGGGDSADATQALTETKFQASRTGRCAV